MKNLLKWILIIGGGIVALFILILLVLPLFVDADRFRPMLEKQVTQATGRNFSVGKDVDLSFFPHAGVAFSDLHLGNPAGFDSEDFVSIRSFEVRVKLLPILFGNIEIKRFVLNEPRLVAIRNKNGKTNWSFDSGKSTPKTADQPAAPSDTTLPITSLTVGDFAIKNGTLIYIDNAAETRNVVEKLDLTMQNLSLDQPVRVELSARFDDKPIGLSGTVGPLGNDPGRGSIPLDVTLTAVSQLQLQARGTLAAPAVDPRFDLAVELAPFSPRELLTALRQPVPAADPDALKRLSLQAELAGSPKAITVSNGLVNLDESRIEFNAQASDFSKPVVSFKADIDRLKLDRYLPPPSEKKTQPAPSTGKDGKGVSDQPAAAGDDPLRRMVLDGELTVESLTLHRAELTDILIQVKARDGVIRMDPLQLQLYGGGLAGKAVYDVRGREPAVAADLALKGVQAGQLLQQQLQKEFLEGVAHADLQFSLAGTSMMSILKTLDGKGQLVFNDGAIKGVDLTSMARNVKDAFQLQKALKDRPRTEFSELRLPFEITGGVMTITDSLLRSPLARLAASGTVDLVERTLDIRLTPKVVATLKGQGDIKEQEGTTVPVLIQGSFSDPQFRPDLKAVAAEQIEKKVLESDKAKELLEKEAVKPYQEEAKGLLKKLLE
jgi:AsmA protein